LIATLISKQATDTFALFGKDLSTARMEKTQISKAKLFEESSEETEHKECVIQKKVTMKSMAFVSQNILMQNLNSVVMGCNAKERAKNES
jgi:hypothetical protein